MVVILMKVNEIRNLTTEEINKKIEETKKKLGALYSPQLNWCTLIFYYTVYCGNLLFVGG